MGTPLHCLSHPGVPRMLSGSCIPAVLWQWGQGDAEETGAMCRQEMQGDGDRGAAGVGWKPLFV